MAQFWQLRVVIARVKGQGLKRPCCISSLVSKNKTVVLMHGCRWTIYCAIVRNCSMCNNSCPILAWFITSRCSSGLTTATAVPVHLTRFGALFPTIYYNVQQYLGTRVLSTKDCGM